MMASTPVKSSIPSSSSITSKSPKSVRFQDDDDRHATLFEPSFIDRLSIWHLLVLGGTFRFILILYGVYHDSKHALKYTDVDYYVFSDAAEYILNPNILARGPLAGYMAEKWGIYIGSPYDRATYRYTPMLAVFLLPNILLHPLFGKCLFSAADLGIALLQYRSLTNSSKSTNKNTQSVTQQDRKAKLLVTCIWLLNPFVANISTRGSAESILGFIVLLFLHLLQEDKINASAIVFGLAVHFKLYPVIYAPTVLAYLHARSSWINMRQIRFAFVSFASFMLLNLAMYPIWGMPFVKHTYMYHLTRLDHRHNFSHYFYQIYLASARSLSDHTPAGQTISSLLSKIGSSTFVPQPALTLGLGFFLTKSSESATISRKLNKSSEGSNGNLPLVLLTQTMIFITFNRVCTSQYFMWYLWFLPLAIPSLQRRDNSRSGISWKKGLFMTGTWVVSQAVWLSLAYRLEFLGEPVFRELWTAGVAFFGVNVGLVWILIDQL